MNGITPIYGMDDEWLWVEFSHEFCCAFADTASKQRAYEELANFTMGSKTIDEYIAQFEHLLEKAGWDRTSGGSLFQFKKGLDCHIHLGTLQKEPMPAEVLDAWEEAAGGEVEGQVFIDASLGPKEFKGVWSNKKDPRSDRQVHWGQDNANCHTGKDVDAMDIDVTRVQNLERSNVLRAGVSYITNNTT